MNIFNHANSFATLNFTSAMFVMFRKLQRSADQSVRHKTHPVDKITFCNCL